MGYQRRVHGDPHPSSAQQSTTSAPTAPAHQTTSKTTINNNTINMTDDSRKGLGDSTSNIPSALSNIADNFHRGPGEGHASGEQVHNRQGQGGITNTADKAQRDVVPDDQKSSGQAAADKASRTADSHKDDKSMMDKAKETLGMGGNNK